MQQLFEQGVCGQLVAALGCDAHTIQQSTSHGGSGGSHGVPPPPPPDPPTADTHALHYGGVLTTAAADGVPMSVDTHNGAHHAGTADAAAVANGKHTLAHPPIAAVGGGGPGGGDPGEEGPAFEAPDAAFEAYVADLVKRRLGKYCQADHPTRVSQEDANVLYAKIKRQVVDKERDAYAQRQAAGTFKPIVRGKLEMKIRDFVRESIKRHLGARG